MTKHPVRLETVAVSVTEDMLEAFEAALTNACPTVGFFCNHDAGMWRVEGVKQVGVNDAELASSLAVAAMMTGVSPVLHRSATEADGWLARTHASFPEQLIGTRFAVRGTHLTRSKAADRITLTLDAGLAFGSGEHGSTRGCLVALEAVARRLPRRILDMGTGSGILAMAAAKVTNWPVLATDIEPWAVRVAGENAKLNRVAHLVSVRLADGWRDPLLRAHGPVRSCLREYFGAAAVPIGAGSGAEFGTRRDGDPRRAARLSGPLRAIGPSGARASAGTDAVSRTVDDDRDTEAVECPYFRI